MDQKELGQESVSADVVIVGGGPAGLSCALSIARGGRSIIICDDHTPRNKNAMGIRNLPGHEGIHPLEYLRLLRRGLEQYPNVNFFDGKVVAIQKAKNNFITIVSSEERIHSKRVVIAEGVEDILPDIPGVMEMWGKYVFHCAYCHGYENVGKKFGAIISNKKYIEMIRLLRGLSSDIHLFINDSLELSKEERGDLENHDVKICDGKISSLVIEENKLKGVLLDTGVVTECDTLFIQNGVRPKSTLGVELGCKLTSGGIYNVDSHGESNIKGVYFAGDVGSRYHSVVMATAVGSHVGICVNADLMESLFSKRMNH